LTSGLTMDWKTGPKC